MAPGQFSKRERRDSGNPRVFLSKTNVSYRYLYELKTAGGFALRAGVTSKWIFDRSNELAGSKFCVQVSDDVIRD